MKQTYLWFAIAASCFGCQQSGGPTDGANKPPPLPTNAVDVELSTVSADELSGEAAVTSPGGELHVHGSFHAANDGARAPVPVIQIVRNDGGVDVIYNSARASLKRDGDRATFESKLAAPSTTGSFRVIAVEGETVFCSAPLTVNE